ncbi:MAG: KpsF/GutQ family sugar-phosphate isomerase [Gemmatimonadetes bacterium]|nr:KpsF/GutQ family sugar-phosphate isomerase [Gemmatimonadota bacterium]
MSDLTEIVAIGREVLRLEAEALVAAERRLDAAFAGAVRLIVDSSGRVLISGVGKSGLVARKIAATLTSTGTAATFLHPIDGLHGDLGIVGPGDVAILLSKSGETEELFGLIESLRSRSVPIIAVTGATTSTLARAAQVTLDAGVATEACPHDLAPTSSTTTALALGDALAVAVLRCKGFSPDQFANLHPGGRLGRRLLLRVSEVMVAPGPLLRPTDAMGRAVESLAHHRGIALIGEGGKLAGVVTAGDLSRIAERSPGYLEIPLASVMTTNPRTIGPSELAASAVGQMERHGIMVLPVVDPSGAVVGAVHLHDLMRAGAV